MRQRMGSPISTRADEIFSSVVQCSSDPIGSSCCCFCCACRPNGASSAKVKTNQALFMLIPLLNVNVLRGRPCSAHLRRVQETSFPMRLTVLTNFRAPITEPQGLQPQEPGIPALILPA